MPKVRLSPVAKSVPFDKTGTLYTADNVENALKEVSDIVEGNFNFSNATSFEVFNDDTISSTTSTTYQTKLAATTMTDEIGKYIIQWSAEIANSSNNQTTLFKVEWKPTSSGTWSLASELDVFIGRSEVYQSTAGFRVVDLLSQDSIDLRIQYSAGGATARIKYVSIYIFRVEV